MADRRFTVTAALPYSNGRLHVGHIAGCYLPADIYVRYLRSVGDEVAFICGSDDYGVPVALTARKEDKQPHEVNERYRSLQKADFDGLGIDFDIYSGTNKPIHTRFAQQFFKTVEENGYLEKRTQKQLYDPEEQMFLPDRYVEGICHHCGATGARGDQCEACGKPINPILLKDAHSVISGAEPEVRETVHWFFRLSKFEQPLKEWLTSKDDWRPMVRNFTRGLLESGLPDRAITRDLDWGIPVPLEDDPDAEGKVLYVWFDAPIGYVSFTAEWCEQQGGSAEDYRDWWEDPETRIVHFIGEDNVVFHALMWPAMLMAEGNFQLPHQVPANCFLNIQFPGEEEQKMSTSRGTAVWIEDYLREYDPDPLRYYLTMIAPEDQRTAFQFKDLISRNNEELVANFGNLVHRTMTFTHKYFDGHVPERHDLTDDDTEQLEMIRALPDAIADQIEEYSFKAALEEFMKAAKQTNRYFDHQEPWVLRKEDMARCGTVVNVLLNTIKVLTVTVEPFLPFAAARLNEMLGCAPHELTWDKATTPLPESRGLAEPEILFEKLDIPENLEGLDQ
ncbi:MAG: methionine--tRNA ligase [Planctomycetes bacterium]|nr:methionine--tRNA ligase [Planctomycetota bacterium]